jgi:DNA-binding transcriptional MerR regulator
VSTPHEELLTLSELAQLTAQPEGILQRFLEDGLIEPARVGEQVLFECEVVLRVRRIARLRRDLRLNLSGLGVVMELLDRLAEMERGFEGKRPRTR